MLGTKSNVQYSPSFPSRLLSTSASPLTFRISILRANCVGQLAQLLYGGSSTYVGTCPIPTSMPTYPASIFFSLRRLNPPLLLLLLLLLLSLCSADARGPASFSTSCSAAVGAWNSGVMVATSRAR